MSEAYLSRARFIYANVTQHKKTEFSAADAHCYLNKLWLYKKVAGLLGMKVGIHFYLWYFSPKQSYTKNGPMLSGCRVYPL